MLVHSEYEFLLKVVDGVLDNPGQARFRQIRADIPVVMRVQGELEALGFVRDDCKYVLSETLAVDELRQRRTRIQAMVAMTLDPEKISLSQRAEVGGPIFRNYSPEIPTPLKPKAISGGGTATSSWHPARSQLMQASTQQGSSGGNPWRPSRGSITHVQGQVTLDIIYPLAHPPIPLRIATWNIGKKFSRKLVQRLLSQGKLDALLLCNVKRPRDPSIYPVTPISYIVSGNADSKTTYYQVHNDFVAIATIHPIDSHRATENGRTIQADISVGGRLVRLITTYVPPHSESRPANTLAADETFQDLSRLARATPAKYELIIGGDFNARPVFPDHPTDKHVGQMRIDNLLDANGQPRFGASNEHSQRLLDLLIQADLCLPDTYLRQAWRRRWTSRNPNNGNCHQHDHFLCRSSGRTAFKRISTRTDITPGSDHRVVCAHVTLGCDLDMREAFTENSHALKENRAMAAGTEVSTKSARNFKLNTTTSTAKKVAGFDLDDLLGDSTVIPHQATQAVLKDISGKREKCI